MKRRITVVFVSLAICVAVCVVARIVLASLMSVQRQHVSDARIQAENARLRMPMLESVRSKVANDQIEASKRMSSITASTLGCGKDKIAEVDAILSDSELNRMSLVYLGSDWSIQRSSFLGNVRHMREILKMQEQERAKAVSEVEKKVKQLEIRKKQLTRSMDRPMLRRGGHQGDTGWFVELRDVNNQLNDLRSSVAYQKMINDDIANERMIEAKAKTEKAIFEMAMLYQEKTIGALNRTIAEQLGALKREESAVLAKIAVLEEDVVRLNLFKRIWSWLDFWPLNLIYPSSGEV